MDSSARLDSPRIQNLANQGHRAPDRLSGIDSASAKGAARLYTRAGFSVVPVPFKKKGCRIQGWADLRITEPEICLHSDAGAQNIGVLTGIGGLTDIDCDAPEAIITGRALLPETTFVFGRQSKRASHYFY